MALLAGLLAIAFFAFRPTSEQKPAAVAGGPPAVPLRIGVATHFDQGWSLDLIDRVRSLDLGAIRDDLPWGKSEPELGRYDFDGPSAAYVERACEAGLKLLLMIDPRHPAWDGNATVYTPAAQRAYADYLNAVLDRYGTECIEAIEIGNEVNAGDPRLPAKLSMASVHAALLRTVSLAVKPRHPTVNILAGSSNMVATGFAEQLFAQGALENADGIVVHPYRDHPEGLEIELPRLRAAMRRHGRLRPVWATEMGDEVDDPVTSASLLLRMLCLLAAEPDMAGVYWYALIDEPYFRNTGLLTPGAAIKPAGEAMLAARRLLLSHGRPVRIHAEDRRDYVYRFGADNYVVWGAPRAIRVDGGAKIFDARGRRLTGVTAAGADPVIVTGAKRLELGATEVFADSLYQYAGAPWSYYARRATGATVALQMIDWTWTSYWGAPDLRPLEIGASSAIPAGDGGNPLAAMVRYTAAEPIKGAVSACFTKTARGDGIRIDVWHNGRVVHGAVLTDRMEIASLPIDMEAGDTLDFAFGPNQTSDGDALTYRIRITRPDPEPTARAACA